MFKLMPNPLDQRPANKSSFGELRFRESNSLARTVFVGSGMGGKTYQITVRALISKAEASVITLPFNFGIAVKTAKTATPEDPRNSSSRRIE